MYKEHSIFHSPENPNQLIWRYMDFTKFVDLLQQSALYFTRADCFDDIFEGSYTQKSKEYIEARIVELRTMKLMPEGFDENQLREITPARTEKAINCWHMNNFESAAMWKLYLKSNDGIAIQTTFDQLKNAFEESELTVMIGTVKYLDYNLEMINPFNGFNSFLHKRKSFEHENELRVIMWDKLLENNNYVNLSDKKGCYIKVNLEKLIENIYVAPDSPI